jgi:phage terminase large subunit-like protein
VTLAIDDCDGRYRFDAERADRVCAFFPRYCSHSKGSFAGQPFEPLEYQTQLILRPIFGWVDQDRLRRFRKAYIEIPKKNGKTQLIAGLGLYMLLADDEPGAEVYVAAADREQARILFDAAKAMVEHSPALRKRLIVYRNRVVRADDPAAFFQVLSSEAASKHGPNIHCLIIDELHAQPDRDLFETLTRGVVARRQPLILLITTAGDDDESICHEEYDYAKRVLSGAIVDERHLPVIFETGPAEDWSDPAVLTRVNPGVGVTIPLEALLASAREAQHEPRKRNDHMRYHTNQWTNQATAWIPVEWWDACAAPLPSDDELRQYPCAAGIDMAQKIDLASGVVGFRLPLEEDVDALPVEVASEGETGDVVKRMLSLDFRVALVSKFWLPDDTLNERVRQDHIRYDIYRDQGLLTVIDGAIMSADPIVKYFVGADGKSGLLKRFPKLKGAQFAYDPAFATEIALALVGYGLTTVEVLQNYKHLSEACQVFEALVKAKRILHGGHRLLRWNVENVTIKTDDAGRIRPVKPRKATKRIDGIVATIMAISRLMLMPPERKKAHRAPKVWTPAGFVPALPPSPEEHP